MIKNKLYYLLLIPCIILTYFLFRDSQSPILTKDWTFLLFLEFLLQIFYNKLTNKT